MTENSKKAPTWKDFEDTAVKAEVLRFLHAMGYQVKKRTFYRNCDEGKVKLGVKNLYTSRTVKQYANTLPRVAGGESDDEVEDSLQNKKLLLDVTKGEINNERDEIKLKREKGSVIDRGALNLEQAARAVVLDSGFKQMVNAQGLEWIVAVNGDTDKLPEFLELIMQEWDDMIDAYNTPDEFEVLFDNSDS